MRAVLTHREFPGFVVGSVPSNLLGWTVPVAAAGLLSWGISREISGLVGALVGGGLGILVFAGGWVVLSRADARRVVTLT